VTLSEQVSESRKTLRAAVHVLALGVAQKALVLTIIYRHFELQAALVARLDNLERRIGHDYA